MRNDVVRHQLEPWFDPDVVFAALHAADDRVFWLDAGRGAVKGYSYVGQGARLVTASLAAGTLTVSGTGEDSETVAGDIFEFLDESARGDITDGAQGSGAGGFRLGWVGWFGYELRSTTMGAPDVPRRSRYPDAAWLEVLRMIEFDHAARTVTLVALGEDWSGERGEWRDSVLAALGKTQKSLAAPVVPSATEVRWRYSDDEYLGMIRNCQAAITRGDAYQLCLTTEVEVDIRAEPAASYLALRASSPSHHGGYLRVGEFSLLSSSPEVFLTVDADGTIESRPIKGTRRRGLTAEEDLALRRELEASEKERAENLMIVDLMRNDIAKVSEVGSVSVPGLLEVESYAQVHQLVSTVRGRLRSGTRPVDAVLACFPAGSMTGAPKSSATSILDGLERRPRGVYSGAFGYFGLDGRIELAMVIRSIVLDHRGATIGTGGGITALSVPEEELDEVKLKAAALLAVLGAGVSGS
ncbi:anthranilate synthase component I family protein [Parafrigoribacterium soli]|uniref:anthranilate synthase component I family protein n=1 Tax=Parafrigoribacterium soli TaxID=3144663 RepID=UPI0032EB00BB